MTYSQVIKYLNSFIDYEKFSRYPYKKSFKLKRFQNFLSYLNNPQKNLKVIHIAGTKGKGSTSAFIAYILRAAGFKVGLYTSPHLTDFRERIRILGQTTNYKLQTTPFEGMISKNDICDLIKRLKPHINRFNKTYPGGKLTFFEVYSALAFQYFKDKNVDFAVLETGLGGRLDATNVCNSLVSILTPISLEHTYLLGNTIKKIALEKASIIKKENKLAKNGKRIVLSAKQDKSAMAVIGRVARKNNAVLLEEGKNFKFSIKKDNTFDYKGLNRLKNLNINLLGAHQVANASLAIASVESLRYHNVKVGSQAIRRGLENCRWPARFEIISRNPTVIIDGAQNSASVRTLNKVIKSKFPHKKVWLIFGIAKDKELKDTCHEVEKITPNIILTKVDNPRASEPKDLLKYFKTNSQILAKDSREALKVAKEMAAKDDIILTTGSLYLCGELRQNTL